MKRFLAALIIGTAPAVAQTPAPDVWQMAHDGDFAGLEQAFATAHAETLSGVASPQSVRDMMTELMVTDNGVIAGTQAWLEAFPQSPYALAAVGWQYSYSGWTVRGSGMSNQTHPDAMAVMQALHADGYGYMQDAFTLAPDFLPASDGMIVFNRVLGQLSFDEIQSLTDDVMATLPNRHTLMLTAVNGSSMWGGPGLAVLEDLCDRYADQISEFETYTPEICFAEIVLGNNVGPDAMRRAALTEGMMFNADFPLAAAMTRHIQHQIQSRGFDFDAVKAAQIAYLEGLEDFGPTNMWLLEMFRRTYSRGGDGSEVMRDNVIFSAVEASYLKLEREPYNPNAISILHRFAGYQGEGRTVIPHNDYTRDLYARQLTMQPYDTDTWTAMAGLFPRPGAVIDADTVPLGDPFYENATVMDYHSAHSVMHALERKLFQVGTADALLEIDQITSQEAQALHTAAHCRVIRLHRLAEYICENGGDDEHGTCGYVTNPAPRLISLLSEAEMNPVCDVEMNGPVMSLTFEYNDIDLSQYIMDDPRPAE